MQDYAVTEMGQSEDFGVTTLGFRANNAGLNGYIIFSFSETCDPQDVALGLDGLHLEIGGQSMSGYHAVEAARMIGPERVHVDLTEMGRERFGFTDFLMDFSNCSGEPLRWLQALFARAEIPFPG